MRDHADGRAQAFLRDVGDVLPVDEDAPALHVVKAQQQVHQRGFARAGAPDQPHFFARADVQVQSADDGLAAAAACFVGEAHVFKAHVAVRDGQGAGLGRVGHGGCLCQGADAVLHRADVFKQAGKFPHDPVADARQAQRHGDDGGHRACAGFAARPQPQRQPAGREHQQHDERVIDDLKRADQAHLHLAGDLERLHRFAGVGRFALAVGKELDGGDVGVGVGHAPGHQAAGVGLLLAGAAQPGHEIPARQPVGQRPQGKRQHQPPVHARRESQEGEHVNAHADDHINGGEHHIAHGQRRLHDFGGHAAGEFVGVERQALPQHQAVKVPAQPHRKADGQRLVLHQRVQRNQRNGCQQHRRQRRQRGAVPGPEMGRIGLADPVHHAAQQCEQQRVKRRAQGCQHGQQRNQAAHALRAGPHERHEPPGRQGRLASGIEIKAVFKKAEHETSFGGPEGGKKGQFCGVTRLRAPEPFAAAWQAADCSCFNSGLRPFHQDLRPIGA